MKTFQFIITDQSGQRTLKYTGYDMQDAMRKLLQHQLPPNTIFSITATTL
jgi:hypothetical protein